MVTETPKYDYPVNDCKFVVWLDVEHEGGQNLKIKYEWIQQTQTGIEFVE